MSETNEAAQAEGEERAAERAPEHRLGSADLMQQLEAEFEHIAADSRAALSRLEAELSDEKKRLAVYLHELLSDVHGAYHALRVAPADLRVAFLSALHRVAFHAEKPR